MSYSIQRRPLLIGKPQTTMFEDLSRVHGLNPSRCLMVGDRLVCVCVLFAFFSCINCVPGSTSECRLYLIDYIWLSLFQCCVTSCFTFLTIQSCARSHYHTCFAQCNYHIFYQAITHFLLTYFLQVRFLCSLIFSLLPPRSILMI